MKFAAHFSLLGLNLLVHEISEMYNISSFPLQLSPRHGELRDIFLNCSTKLRTRAYMQTAVNTCQEKTIQTIGNANAFFICNTPVKYSSSTFCFRVIVLLFVFPSNKCFLLTTPFVVLRCIKLFMYIIRSQEFGTSEKKP